MAESIIKAQYPYKTYTVNLNTNYSVDATMTIYKCGRVCMCRFPEIKAGVPTSTTALSSCPPECYPVEIVQVKVPDSNNGNKPIQYVINASDHSILFKAIDTTLASNTRASATWITAS